MNSAVIKKRTGEHLDPQHDTHVQDYYAALKARQELASNLTVSIAPAEPLKFPSLAGGKRLDPTGCELSPQEFQERIKEAQKRTFYWADYKKRDGTLSQRRCPTVPVQQSAVSYFPAYDLAFARIEQRGLGIAPAIHEHAQTLINEFTSATGYEVVAAAVHPEEGNLHHHLIWTHVDKDNRLLHNASGRGRRGPRFLGPSLIGTLRLVDKGIWPEEDATLARKFFADRVRKGESPIDWVLSQVLDGLAEKTLMGLSAVFPWVRGVWEEAEADYRATAVERRAARPDLMAQRLTSLESENANLRAEVERLRSAPVAPPAILAPPMRGTRMSSRSRGISL
jgi:hypothetical protein